MPGGIMRHNILTLVGAIAIDNFKKFFGDKLFLAADGIDVNLGLSSPDLEEAALKRTMIKMARKVIVVADSSKFGRSEERRVGKECRCRWGREEWKERRRE